MAIWWVGLGGFLGANARYLLGGFISQRWGTVFPLGTFVINVTGSFILGFFLAYAQDRPWLEPSARLTFAVGFVGAYTTFSTFEYETMRLIQQREFCSRCGISSEVCSPAWWGSSVDTCWAAGFKISR